MIISIHLICANKWYFYIFFLWINFAVDVKKVVYIYKALELIACKKIKFSLVIQLNSFVNLMYGMFCELVWLL